MSVIGVDPGLNGALAYYNAKHNSLVVWDMPTWNMQVGRKVRKRVDAVELIRILETTHLFGIDLMVMEAVGGRPRQSASGGFQFGYVVGLVYMAAIMLRIPIDTVTPQVWKRFMKVPGKAMMDKEANAAIVARADELMPDHRDKWRGKMGGLRVDRAEAALLAKFGEERMLPSVNPTDIRDPEWRLLYTGNPDTGS